MLSVEYIDSEQGELTELNSEDVPIGKAKALYAYTGKRSRFYLLSSQLTFACNTN
jgi:hypothetical protein